MFQVRFHGRGGQGVVTAAGLLASAAFREDRHAQAFPSFGSERMGAPVISFCRIDDKPIRTHEPVTEPDARPWLKEARPMLKQIEGSRAAAEAVAMCRPQVICAHPISPQTHIVEALSASHRRADQHLERPSSAAPGPPPSAPSSAPPSR
jgi:Pyruvate ferredoxin/flavodoxin oxidoreductase